MLVMSHERDRMRSKAEDQKSSVAGSISQGVPLGSSVRLRRVLRANPTVDTQSTVRILVLSEQNAKSAGPRLLSWFR